ncbi:MAG: carboxypeptidase-like regulatory domain-containing protein, partial [Bacteroidota bacterium]|nr:carboxypeptidase-like regulatory domain-containing protein [Bacteroidota bacterium]
MKPRHLLVTLLALFSSFSAIQAETSATGAISGIILDDATDAALDFVNVVLYKKNTTVPVKGLSTDKDGTFQFANIPSGQYRIEATYVGYVTWSTLCNVANGQHVKLGSIMMKTNSKELGAAEVTGIRSTMKFDIDKRIFSVDQSIAAAGASASDILKDIPSVQVDQEGTVTLRNSSDVTVWINGKPSGLTSDNQGQVLEQLPAESIDRVEVVTNPSSKYSAEGTAGIINIILKKDRKAGYFGSLRAGVSNPDGYNFGGNFNYNSPKIDFYANIGRRVNTNHGTGSGSRQTFTASGDTSYMNSSTNRNFNMNGLFFRSGIDYHFTDKQTLSLSGFGMDGHRNFESNIDYQYLNASQALSRTVQ